MTTINLSHKSTRSVANKLIERPVHQAGTDPDCHNCTSVDYRECPGIHRDWCNGVTVEKVRSLTCVRYHN